MSELSLVQLKNALAAKGGYNTLPQNRCLNDLKIFLNDLNTVRNGTRPAAGITDASGTTCAAHVSGFGYNNKLSLGDINNAVDNIKALTCNSVVDNTCGCVSRTACSCNAQGAVCTCNARTTCDCQTRTACSCNAQGVVCTCNARTPDACDCQSRTGASTCDSRKSGTRCGAEEENGCNCDYYDCSCESRTAQDTCTCNTRITACDCQSRTGACGTVYYTPCNCDNRTNTCDCVSRTGTCGTVIAQCTCDGRCACNAEKRFG